MPILWPFYHDNFQCVNPFFSFLVLLAYTRKIFRSFEYRILLTGQTELVATHHHQAKMSDTIFKAYT